MRIYFRRNGAKIRLRGPIGSPEFLEDYRAAFAGVTKPAAKSTAPVPKSVRYLCAEYYKSASFRELDPRTQAVRRGLLDRFCQNKGDGDKPFALYPPKHIRARSDEMVDRPEAANGMIKALRQL